MKMYTTYMSALGVGSGINFKFGGIVANTLNAHRLIQWVQEKYGAEKADAVVNCKYISTVSPFCSRVLTLWPPTQLYTVNTSSKNNTHPLQQPCSKQSKQQESPKPKPKHSSMMNVRA